MLTGWNALDTQKNLFTNGLVEDEDLSEIQSWDRNRSLIGPTSW